MNQPDLELTDVVVCRGERTILHVPDLVVPHHAFLGVVGPNGSGKTTLLGVCAGLVRPTSGEVTVTGLPLNTLSRRRRTNLRRHIGVVPQRADYNPNVPLTVREIVSLGLVGPRGLFHRLTPDDHARVETWLTELGLAPLARRSFRSLSGGEQQKVLIARAMVHQPGLLLLDEPAANLDIDWKARVVELIEQLHERHPVTVVMVSHETGLLPACCSHVALLSSGDVLKVGPREEVFTTANLSRMYHCAVEVVEVRGRFHAVVLTSAGGPDR